VDGSSSSPDGVGGRPDGQAASGTVVKTIAHHVTHLMDLYRRLDSNNEAVFVAELEKSVLKSHDVLVDLQGSPHGWPATFTGTSLFVNVPSPSVPNPFCPQQYATWLVVTPQTCSSPTLTLRKTSPPGTSAGIAAPAPQQYAAPVVVRPHVRVPPALSAVKVSPPLTGTGTELELFDPSPSWPTELKPQQ